MSASGEKVESSGAGKEAEESPSSSAPQDTDAPHPAAPGAKVESSGKGKEPEVEESLSSSARQDTDAPHPVVPVPAAPGEKGESSGAAGASSSSSSARQDADPPDPVAVALPPPWVVLVSKPRILASAEDERARAMRRRAAALDPRDPPESSYLVLHPGIAVLHPDYFARQPSACILAADPSGLLLFRITKPNPDLDDDEPVADEIMYLWDIHSRRRTTKLLAIPYPDFGIEPQPRRSFGLIADTRRSCEGNYQVVQLIPRPLNTVSLGDKLLYYDAMLGKWYVKALHTTSEVRDRNLRGEAGVLAHAGRLYWLALGYGIFICDDPFATPSHLRFVPLPDGCIILDQPTELNRMYVALRRRLAPSEGRLRFVDVQDSSVRMWTLIESEGEEPRWRFEYEVHFADVWAHDAITAGLPPGEVPHVALVDPDDHRVIYFHNTEGNKLFSLDERTKRVVSCADCPVSDDRGIMLQNNRPVVDAWEQSPPPPPPFFTERPQQGNFLARIVLEFQKFSGNSYFF